MMLAVNADDMRSTDDQLKQCRICLDSDNPGDIISPCLCSGSSAYVHRKCLNNWRSQNASGRTFKFCDICQFKYILENVIYDPKADRERLLKCPLFVIRDITLIILLIQAIIIGLAFLLKAVDRNGNNIKQLFPVTINGFVVYYLSAFILLLAVIGFLVLIALCYARGISTNSGDYRRNNPFKNRGSNENGLLLFIGIVVLICAFIALFVGIILGVIILRKILKHHTNKLWLRQEANKYIAQDFRGRRSELERYKNNLSAQSFTG